MNRAVVDGLKEGLGAFITLVVPWILAAIITGEWRNWE